MTRDPQRPPHTRISSHAAPFSSGAIWFQNELWPLGMRASFVNALSMKHLTSSRPVTPAHGTRRRARVPSR